ncbi:MAG: hypothetical protein WDO70_05355 [Alphaproteobacteria bacterium]
MYIQLPVLLERIIAVAQETTACAETTFEELKTAAFNARFAMRASEFHYAAEVSGQYLGRDTLRERRAAEFAALPQQEKDELASARDYGEYGIYHLVSQPEVELALKIVAHELCPQRKILDESDLADLAKPGQIEAISARFPEISPERIQHAMRPRPPLKMRKPSRALLAV